jgi:hypothetical protein
MSLDSNNEEALFEENTLEACERNSSLIEL